MELPLINQKDHILYPHYALKLNIIETNSNLNEWVLQHFGNCYVLYPCDSVYVFYVDYTEDLYHFADNLFHRYIFPYTAFSYRDFVKWVKEYINSGYYSYIYLSDGVMNNDDRKTVHPYLIYGYDDDNQCFSVCGMSKSGVPVNSSIAYNVVYQAFTNENCNMIEQNGTQSIKRIEFLKLKDFTGGYIFQIPKFIKVVRDYLNSTLDFENLYSCQGCVPPAYAGLETTKMARIAIENEEIQIVPFYGIVEHKRGLLTRLRFVANIFHNSFLEKLIEDYHGVVQLYNIIENMLLKCSINSSLSKNKSEINKKLEQAVTLEENLLGDIYELISKLYECGQCLAKPYYSKDTLQNAFFFSNSGLYL